MDIMIIMMIQISVNNATIPVKLVNPKVIKAVIHVLSIRTEYKMQKLANVNAKNLFMMMEKMNNANNAIILAMLVKVRDNKNVNSVMSKNTVFKYLVKGSVYVS